MTKEQQFFFAKQKRELQESTQRKKEIETLLGLVLASNQVTFDCSLSEGKQNPETRVLTYRETTLLARGLTEEIRFLTEEIRSLEYDISKRKKGF